MSLRRHSAQDHLITSRCLSMTVTKLPPPKPGDSIPTTPASLIQVEYLQSPTKSVAGSICLSILIQELSRNTSWLIFRSLATGKSKRNRKSFVTLPRSVVGNTVPDGGGVRSHQQHTGILGSHW